MSNKNNKVVNIKKRKDASNNEVLVVLEKMQDSIALIAENQVGTNQRMDGIEKRLDGIDLRLDGIDQRIDDMDTKFTKKFEEVDEKFTIVLDYLSRIEDEFIDLKKDFRQLKKDNALTGEKQIEFEKRMATIEKDIIKLKTQQITAV